MIVTICNRRGGVGKTLTCRTLGAGLLKRGYKVLYIDLDSQNNLTYDLGASTTGVTAYDILTNRASITDGIQSINGADILKGSPRLASADMILTDVGKEYRLKEQLEEIQERYSFILIDTPPSLGITVVNALTASDRAIIPVQAEIHSINGVSLISETIDTVRRYCNSRLITDGILITRYNNRSILARDMSDNLQEQARALGTRLYNTRVRECVALKESQAVQQDIFSYAPRSNGAKDYNEVVEEFLRGCKK